MFDLGGLLKGLKYFATCGHMLVTAVKTGNQQEVKDLSGVFGAFADDFVQAEKNPLSLFSDPFRGSRKAAQDVIAKYAKK